MIINRNRHLFVVANTIPPYKVSVYSSGVAFLNSGGKKLQRCEEDYHRYIIGCEKYEPTIEEL